MKTDKQMRMMMKYMKKHGGDKWVKGGDINAMMMGHGASVAGPPGPPGFPGPSGKNSYCFFMIVVVVHI